MNMPPPSGKPASGMPPPTGAPAPIGAPTDAPPPVAPERPLCAPPHEPWIGEAYNALNVSGITDAQVLAGLQGRELEKLKREDDAVALYEAVVRDGSDIPHSYNRLGVIYRRRKDFANEQRVLRLQVKNGAGGMDALEKSVEKHGRL